MTARSAGALKTGLRIAVAALLFAAALSLVETGALADVVAAAKPVWFAPALVCVAVNAVLESMQFAAAARAFGDRLGFADAIRLTLVGRFFSLFTPSMLGGDIYRAVAMRGRGAPAGKAVSLAAASRVMSLIALAPVLLTGMPLIALHAGLTAVFAAFAALILAVAAGALALLFAPARWVGAAALRRVPLVGGLGAGVADLRYAALAAPSARALWLTALAQHLVRVVVLALTARAFGVDAGLDVFFAFAPISLLVAMAPVSVGSWGLREVALVYSLGIAGVPAGAALLTSIAFGLYGVGLALIGGLMWMRPAARGAAP